MESLSGCDHRDESCSWYLTGKRINTQERKVPWEGKQPHGPPTSHTVTHVAFERIKFTDLELA